MSQAPMSDITSDDKLWAALAYLPITPLWPIIAILVFFLEGKKDRPYIRFHAIQSIVIGSIGIITSAFCVGVLILLYMFYLAYLAYQGDEVKVLFVTDFIKNQGWA